MPKTRVLCHFENNFNDECGNPSNAGTLNFATNVACFGSYALRGVGTASGLQGQVYPANLSDALGDYCIEAFVKMLAAATSENFSFYLKRAAGTNVFVIYFLRTDNTVRIRFSYGNLSDSSNVLDTGYVTVSYNTNVHLVIERHNGILTLYVNGTPIVSSVDGGAGGELDNYDLHEVTRIDCMYAYNLNFGLDDFRITADSVYRGPFTPPTSQLEIIPDVIPVTPKYLLTDSTGKVLTDSTGKIIVQ